MVGELRLGQAGNILICDLLAEGHWGAIVSTTKRGMDVIFGLALCEVRLKMLKMFRFGVSVALTLSYCHFHARPHGHVFL